jgi:hypothetical protein
VTSKRPWLARLCSAGLGHWKEDTMATDNPAPLDVTDPAALALWANAMDDAFADLEAVLADMLQRRRARKLGPLEHHRLSDEALGALRFQVRRAALAARDRANVEG